MMRRDIQLEAIHAFYSEPTKLEFYDVARAHAEGNYSYIVRTDSAFILAREVGEGWGDEEIIDGVWESDDSTQLHITLAVGDLSQMVQMIPDHVQTLSFQRRGYKIHKMSVDRLKSLVVSQIERG